MDWGKEWFVDFNAGKTLLVSFDHSNNNGAIDVKMNGSVLEEKSCFQMLGLMFSSKLDFGSYIISIAKTVSKEIAALIHSMKFLALFYRYYFGRCSSELAQLVPLTFSRGRSTRCSDRLHDFSATIPRCYKDVYVNSFLAQLNSGILFL